MAGVNTVRGEVSCVIAGTERRLCLTLGALAEMEAALGVGAVDELAERLRRVSARDLLAVLAALLRGAGETDVADALPGARIDLAEAASAVARAFEAASA